MSNDKREQIAFLGTLQVAFEIFEDVDSPR